MAAVGRGGDPAETSAARIQFANFLARLDIEDDDLVVLAGARFQGHSQPLAIATDREARAVGTFPGGIGPERRPAQSIQVKPFEASKVVGRPSARLCGFEELANPGGIRVLPFIRGEIDAADIRLASASIALRRRLKAQ